MRRKAERASGARRASLEAKIAVLAKMMRFARSVPDDWGAHGRLAGTEKGMGVHALNLDVDVGPLLQTQKLLTSVLFARRKGYSAPLTAAELEMMNLTGDGNGFDMVQMPPAMREKVPTSNFFQQGGYERNPVAIHNNTVAKLLAATDAKMVKEAKLAGAREPRRRVRRRTRQGADDRPLTAIGESGMEPAHPCRAFQSQATSRSTSRAKSSAVVERRISGSQEGKAIFPRTT